MLPEWIAPNASIHYRLKNICEAQKVTDYVENLAGRATNSSNDMQGFICIQIVSGGLYDVIKLNVPL